LQQVLLLLLVEGGVRCLRRVVRGGGSRVGGFHCSHDSGYWLP
jgi:hypothetical protein